MYSIIGRWIKTYSNQVVDYFQENDEKSRRNSLSATESPTVEWERVREGIHVTISMIFCNNPTGKHKTRH